ncbi:MAG: hypothetical protein H0V35_11130 [Nitrospira sp.]|nr:hypothetical protein [Nitrospira sp.]
MEREKMGLKETDGSTIRGAATDTFESAENMTRKAGDAIGSAAESLRQAMPGGGKMGDAAETISRGVQQTADYLQREGMGGIVEDLETLIRRYPLQTLLLGVGCGYLVSRLRTD